MTTVQPHPDAPSASILEHDLPARPQKQRLGWVDCAKGIGIVLVVYGHAVGGLVDAGIQSRSSSVVTVVSLLYTFHMPVFFFVAGLWLTRTASRPLSRFFADKAGTMLYPYVLWSAIQLSVNMIAAPYTNQSPRPTDLLAIAYHPYAQFWFLYVLFIDVTIAALCFRYRLGSILLAVAVAVLYSSANYLLASPWPVGAQLAMSFPFVAAGAFLGPRLTSSNFEQSSRGRGVLTAAACFAMLLAVYFALPATISCRIPLTGAFGVAFVLATCRVIAGTIVGRLFEFLGGRSLEIYVLHVMATAGARIVLTNGAGISASCPQLVIGVGSGLVFPIVVWWVAAKLHLPLFTFRLNVGADRETSAPAAVRHASVI